MADPPSGKITLGRYMWERLHQVGVDTVFGVPGDFNLQFLDSIYHTAGLKFITLLRPPDEPLDRVALIVDDEDERCDACFDHRSDLLDRQCHGAWQTLATPSDMFRKKESAPSPVISTVLPFLRPAPLLKLFPSLSFLATSIPSVAAVA